MPELATQLTCTGCGACADVCPRSALAMTLDQEGFALPQVDAGRCVECGLCTKACPALDPKPAEPRAGFPQPFAAWSGTPEFRRAAASGGVFAEMAAQVVRSGGAVAGVRTEGVTVRHDLATTLEGVRAFQGSKYLQSETGDIYRRVLGRLKQGQRVLFSGTPCQVAGMIQRAEGQRGRENLVTCDVVCRGVPSRHFWQRYVDSAGSAMSLVSFRDKQEGWRDGFAVTLREGGTGRLVRSTYHTGTCSCAPTPPGISSCGTAATPVRLRPCRGWRM
jgi:coenzyme F420-reducing hydrogenase beta subunit